MKKLHAVVVLPTYNEKGNIAKILEAIISQRPKMPNVILSVLVVDDSSPDGTGEVVKRLGSIQPGIYVLTGKKQGLGVAYIRGFRYAMKQLNADIVLEMDADFSHNPNDIPRLIAEIEEGNTFVIGSRYISGGSIPNNWSLLRKVNSKFGNIFARYIARMKKIKDCTGGFRAISTGLLQQIDLKSLGVKGYAFQISLLHEAIVNNAVIKEVPIHFKDRTAGESKIRISDITEFMQQAVLLGFPSFKIIEYFLWYVLVGFFGGLTGLTLIHSHILNWHTAFIASITSISLLLTFQGCMSIYWMLYTWEDPERIRKTKSPRKFIKPLHSFTALVPARHEEHVIGETLHAIAAIDYPERLKETIVICRADDKQTIKKVEEAIQLIGKNNIKLEVFYDEPINKPHALNIGFQKAMKDIIVVFDAEDEPHKDIYQVANTVFSTTHPDILQSGVQLMNYRSSWYSTLNVLEYFFWFKSTLHFFASKGFIPLGGNTVFFKKSWIKRVDGWDENCLTEDADIGIRLSSKGAKTQVVYDERHATREETPHTVTGFIQQRTRWKQGFLQVLLKADWTRLPKLSQRLMAAYVLGFPIFELCMAAYIPVSIIMIEIIKLPILVAMISILPLYVMILQVIIYIVGLYEFTEDYKLQYPLTMPLKILVTFIPFQLVLGFSVIRAIVRLVNNKNAWEKTLHLNVHREPVVKPIYMSLTN